MWSALISPFLKLWYSLYLNEFSYHHYYTPSPRLPEHFLHIKDSSSMLTQRLLRYEINWLFNKSKFKFAFMYLILFGIHHYDLIVIEIQYRIFFFLMISQLHQDNNTAVEDPRGRRGREQYIYLQFPTL